MRGAKRNRTDTRSRVCFTARCQVLRAEAVAAGKNEKEIKEYIEGKKKELGEDFAVPIDALTERYAPRIRQFNSTPVAVNPLSPAPPHARPMGVHRTCGA